MRVPKMLIIIVILVILKSFLIDGITTKTFNDFDEARYAEIVKNIHKTGEILIPLAGGPDEPRDSIFTRLPNGEYLYPFFWKPPLTMWIQGLSTMVFGLNEFSVRFPSLLASLGILLILYQLSKEYRVDEKITMMLIAIFALSQDFSFLSTQGTTDALLTMLGLFVILLAYKDNRYGMVVAGVVTGLAILTKSVAAFWIPLMYLLILCTNKKFSLKRFTVYTSAICITALPWILYMFTRYGDSFLLRHFFYNFKGGSAAGQNFAPVYWYFLYMIYAWKPILLLSPLIAYHSIRALIQKNRKIMLIVVWILLILIPYSISPSKVWWYIYPMWPPVILLAGIAIKSISEKKAFFLLSIVLVASSYIGIRESLKRPDWNVHTKTLAMRNRGITGLSVLGKPYEAALFYFDTGNVTTDIKHLDNTRYILTTKEFSHNIDDRFSVIDSEGDLLLFKRANFE